MEQINLTFSPEQLNIVIGSLVERPFKEVAEVMQHIQNQLMAAQNRQPQADTNVVPMQSAS